MIRISRRGARNTTHLLIARHSSSWGLLGIVSSADFRWIQVRFTLTTSDVTITPALQAFEVVAEYPSEISAGSISLAGDALDETFSFKSHLSAIQRIVAARNAEFRVTDDYELDIAERFGVTTPAVTYTVHDNCEVIRFQQQDRRLSTEIWSLGSAGQGLTQPFETSASESATEAYGSRPWIYTPNATTEIARTQEIADELALRDTPTNAVVIEETDTVEDIAVGDLVSFEYTERSIDTTLRVIAITVADPRLGTPRQIELISDEGFFASQADAISGVTAPVTEGTTGTDAEDLDILEWYWFQPVDVNSNSSGEFSGVVLPGVEGNLNNPSGATVTLTVASRSSSLTSASINANGDLVIAFTGLAGNLAASVTIEAAATVGGVARTVPADIDLNLVYPPDAESVTEGDISAFGFITAGDPAIPDVSTFITAGDPAIPDVSSFITAGDPAIPDVSSFITAGDAAIPDVSDFITLGDVPAPPDVSGFITAGDSAIPDVSDFITLGDVPAPPDVSDFITAGDIPPIPSTAGFITTGDLTAATMGFITIGDVPDAADTSQFLTSGDLPGDLPDVSDFITFQHHRTYQISSRLPGDVPPPPDVSGFITAGDPAIPDVSDFITLGDVPPPPDVSDFITVGDIPPIPSTMGFITIGDVTDLAYITAGDPAIPSTAGFITAGDPVIPSTMGFITIGEVTDLAYITAGDVPDAADTSQFLTAGDLPDVSAFITAGDPAIPSTMGFITAGDPAIPSTMGFITAGDPAIPSTMGFITAGDPAIPSTMGFITAGDPAIPSTMGFITIGDVPVTTGDLPSTQGSSTGDVPVTTGDLPSTAGFITIGDVPVTTGDIPSDVQGSSQSEMCPLRQAIYPQPRDLSQSEMFVTTGDIPDVSDFITAGSSAIPDVSDFITAGDSAIPDVSDFVTDGDIPSTAGFVTTGDLPDVSDFITAGDSAIPDVSDFVTEGEIPDVSDFITAGAVPSTSGLITIGDVTGLSYVTIGAVVANEMIVTESELDSYITTGGDIPVTFGAVSGF